MESIQCRAYRAFRVPCPVQQDLQGVFWGEIYFKLDSLADADLRGSSTLPRKQLSSMWMVLSALNSTSDANPPLIADVHLRCQTCGK